jgi:hypothetical protein
MSPQPVKRPPGGGDGMGRRESLEKAETRLVINVSLFGFAKTLPRAGCLELQEFRFEARDRSLEKIALRRGPYIVLFGGCFEGT